MLETTDMPKLPLEMQLEYMTTTELAHAICAVAEYAQTHQVEADQLDRMRDDVVGLLTELSKRSNRGSVVKMISRVVDLQDFLKLDLDEGKA